MTGSDRLAVLEHWLVHGVWVDQQIDGIRLVGLNIKVTPQNIFCILKGVSAEGPKVAFYTPQGVDGLRRVLQDPAGRDSLRWRDDQFAT
jgi:hypothetical protein